MASELLESPVGASDPIFVEQNKGGAKTWEEIKAVVKDTRKLVSSLASRVPSNFQFRTQDTPNGPITRLYFLGIPPKQRESTLMYVNVPSVPMSITPMLQWCSLLESFSSTLSNSGQMSREEQLLRERKRLGVFGITSYELTEKGKLVFPACNTLFTCSDENLTSVDPVFPQNIDTNVQGARMDPQICPNNSDLVAFVNCNDLWVVNTKTGQEVRLTHSNKGTGCLKEDPYSSGVPSFVVQEEFDRYTGYWWEPKCDKSPDSKTYRILYEEVDESEVDILQIYSPLEDKGVDEYRYPRPGKTNAKSCLKIVEFSINETDQISETVVCKCLYESISSLFPSMEYLLRAGWTPDAKYVHCQLLNRKQTHLSLVLIPTQCFIVTKATEDVDMEATQSEKYPNLHVIHEDASEIWVNVHDILHFLPGESQNEINFIWMSERSGFRHLYKISSKLASQQVLGQSELHDDVLRCECSTVTAITSGEWEVSPKECWVDESRQLVYFIGLKDTPLETHLYVTSYSTPGDPVRLTELGYSHSVSFNKERTLFVSVYSSAKVTPMSTLHQITHSESAVKTQPIGVLMPSSPCPDYSPPELFNFKSKSGYTMYGMYYKPHNYQPGVKYPTVLFVYGGPHVQLVSNTFKGLKFLRLHTLSSQGYAVVLIDGRGSWCRGLKFESHIKNRLGTTEIEDQVEGLQSLMSMVDFIDENRIAIHGWSYGGYLSLMGLAQRPDIFKVAIAGAPVVDWHLYDTGYTERYMDVPESNTYGYQQGNVLSYIDNFPNEENRLMIVHGLIDENVHFQHSSILVNALIKACKPHQIQIYPNERHGIRNPESSEHYKTLILTFLQKHL
ncbi:dipeptidyl peptidase 9-like [Mercenaria mercenaria]|uniref:dipeptidyl peptidase 9-like n=1 Tax=Mercenaria mercenaria TaxID=6596 RepID=UPI00234F4F94|nr:dipeptidyl peptidase 9-like [Mercenaria mercenaria]